MTSDAIGDAPMLLGLLAQIPTQEPIEASAPMAPTTREAAWTP